MDETGERDETGDETEKAGEERGALDWKVRGDGT